jgi:hypothetical protein
MNNAAIALLERARSLIADEGDWSPHGPGTARRFQDEGTRCALIALQHAWHIRDNPLGAYQQARDAIYDAIGLRWDGVITLALGRWNDTPGRTHAEVLAAFDKAKEALANG